MIPFTNYISERFSTYQIEVPDIAMVYIACHKSSNPIDDLQSFNDSLDSDPTKLTLSLKKNFAYGGSRLAKYLDNKSEGQKRAIRSVNFLAIAESHMKHAVINRAIEEGALNSFVDHSTNKTIKHLKAENDLQQDIEIGYDLPSDYLNLKILGARCMILPATAEIDIILKDVNHPDFNKTAENIFAKVGSFLNGLEAANLVNLDGSILKQSFIEKGKINLTPDFGRFAKIADILNQFTPQVLCLNADAGGCCGKVDYTVTGILAGWKACIDNNLCSFNPKETSITFVGSTGALGEVIVEDLRKQKFQKVRICDLQYKLDDIVQINEEADLSKVNIKSYIKDNDSFQITTKTDQIINVSPGDKLVGLINGGYQAIPKEWKVIEAIEGKYTDEALEEKEIILSTAVGREIENSNYHLIAAGTLFLAAHNIAIPLGDAGLNIVKELQKQQVIFVPGQVLTLGGALTSRLEASHRSEHKIIKADEGKNENIFPKRLAHEIVRGIIYHITSNIINKKSLTPWEALLDYANLKDLLDIRDDESDSVSSTKFVPYDIRY